ncbi:hypothetical protein [Actinomadura sp. 9N407]|uniref:hypothetical protein n=1 Tax=Actinomadura sp. 9N407 TaxID=3375154 RepID=UPI0037A518DA
MAHWTGRPGARERRETSGGRRVVLIALTMDLAALLVFGAAWLPSSGRWSRTGLILVAASLALLSCSVWLAAGGE